MVSLLQALAMTIASFGTSSRSAPFIRSARAAASARLASSREVRRSYSPRAYPPPLHTSAATSALDPTAAVDIQVQAISTEVHGLATPRPGFPDNIGAGCSTRPLGKFVRVQ